MKKGALFWTAINYRSRARINPVEITDTATVIVVLMSGAKSFIVKTPVRGSIIIQFGPENSPGGLM
jgi:hypothetical protein